MHRVGSTRGFSLSVSLPALRLVRAAVLGAALLVAPVPAYAAPPNVDTLIGQLENGADFRVRVQAALDLGKTKSSRARASLEAALDDDNAAVRAAAAAALKVLGDARALVALRKHKNDESPAVRAQIENSIAALVAKAKPAKAERPELLVQIGRIRNGSSLPTQTVEADVKQASREKLSDLPGVAVVDGNDAQPQSDVQIPVVMVTGRVKQLAHTQEGSAVVYSASVEFVLHKMPGQTITGVVSGSAKASGAASQIRDREAMDDLRRTALNAAIESALRRAPPALRAAAQ